MEINGTIEDIDLGYGGEILPPENNLVALIDADTLAYTSCVLCEQREDMMPREFYTDAEWEEAINNPNYDEESHAIWTINLEEAYEKAMEKLDRIYQKTGCRSCEMHFSDGRDNFRYKVYPAYKANRKGRSPAGLRELKYKLHENFEGTISTEWEADDIVVYLKESNPEKYMMVAVDKDLLYSVVGTHFNYYESSQYNIDMKFVDVDAETQMKWPYIQALVGDSVDGIKGVKGVGKAKAPKMLSYCTTPAECWEVVKQAYEDSGETFIQAIVTMQLVDMHQFNGKEIVLWNPNNI
jgi:hypothetical protein